MTWNDLTMERNDRIPFKKIGPVFEIEAQSLTCCIFAKYKIGIERERKQHFFHHVTQGHFKIADNSDCSQQITMT